MTKVPTTNCDFCSEFIGDVENAFDRIYRRNPKSRMLLRSDEFVVIPSLGQIAEGHLLLLPITHWTALGDLPESLSGQFAELFNSVTTIVRQEYGPCVTFEHGVRPGSTGGCGIYHAHLHVVPLPATLDPIDSLKSKFAYKEIGHLSDIGKQSEGMSGYLFYLDSRSKAYLFDAPNLASQFMRRVLADAMATNNWDWRTAGREERLLATLNRLSGNFDKLGFSAGPVANESHR